MLIGPAEERWDAAFIARYNSAAAFLEMVTDPAYRAAVVHRQAAVQNLAAGADGARRRGRTGFG